MFAAGLVLAGLISVGLILAPPFGGARALAQRSGGAARDSSGGGKPSAQELASEVRFLKARLALADENSFYLVLDAPARTLTLELGGVPLRVCPIQAIELDRHLDRRRRASGFQDSLALPLHVVSKEGTIPEIPPAIDVDTTMVNITLLEKEMAQDIAFALTYDRHLVLHVVSRSDSGRGESWRQWKPRASAAWRWLRHRLGQWFESPRAASQGEIFILLKRTDARAIFRAIPEESGLALRL